jgi:hypothetical protein
MGGAVNTKHEVSERILLCGSTRPTNKKGGITAALFCIISFGELHFQTLSIGGYGDWVLKILRIEILSILPRHSVFPCHFRPRTIRFWKNSITEFIHEGNDIGIFDYFVRDRI